MGKAQPKLRPGAQASSSEPESSAVPEKLNLLDQQALKHKLDEKAIDVVVNCGYEEDYYISNVKLLLGFIAIVLAVYAHFGPGTFPNNWWIVFGCVVGYLVLTTIHNYFAHHKEPEAYFASRSKLGTGYLLYATSNMDRFSEMYQLKVKLEIGSEQSEHKLEESIEKFFHEDGYLAEEPFSRAVQKLISKCESDLAAKGNKSAAKQS